MRRVASHMRARKKPTPQLQDPPRPQSTRHHRLHQHLHSRCQVHHHDLSAARPHPRHSSISPTLGPTDQTPTTGPTRFEVRLNRRVHRFGPGRGRKLDIGSLLPSNQGGRGPDKWEHRREKGVKIGPSATLANSSLAVSQTHQQRLPMISPRLDRKRARENQRLATTFLHQLLM